MRINSKLTLFSLLILIHSLISGCFVADLLFGDPCGNILGKKLASPNKEYIASTVIRNCGATTSYVIFLFIKKSDNPNVDIKNAQNISRVATIEGGNRVDFAWSSDRVLTVKYGSLKLLRHLSKWNEIEIKYQK
jgi:hypothetical protein